MPDAELVALLRCPQTGQPLRAATPEECARAGFAEALSTVDGRVIYPVRDGIPVILIDEARAT